MLEKKRTIDAQLSRLKLGLLNNVSQRNRRDSDFVKQRLLGDGYAWEKEIALRLLENRPLLFGRLGGLEAHSLGIYLDMKNGAKNPIRYVQAKLYQKRKMLQLQNNAGVYPNNMKTFRFFCEEHLAALGSVDLLSVWAQPFAWVESKFVSNKRVLVVNGTASYPWFKSRDNLSPVGWGHALANQKVLVISPFIDSIAVQVPKMASLFDKLEIPEIKFDFLKAPLTQGGPNDGLDYEKHLTAMKQSMEKMDFDIALVSAGGYSLPVAAHAKIIGKKGVHAGGALQLLFGITGRRYDESDHVKEFINSFWKRPFDHERPDNWKTIEGGCYW